MQLSPPSLHNVAVPTRSRRILTIDGGGVRGVFALSVLKRIQDLLRESQGRPDLTLADHFDLIGGTSTGAIIAAFLAWGESVERVQELYRERAREMFRPSRWQELRYGRFSSAGLTAFLQEFFVDTDGEPARLGTARLQTLLLMCLRNASKGSAWVLTNNPQALFNQNPVFPNGELNPDCNLNLPLWQIVRGSTAAPFFFGPETVQVGRGKRFQFVDGGLTAYNNPSVIAVLNALLPCYGLGWRAGPEFLHLVSIGTGRTRAAINPRLRDRIPFLRHLAAVPKALIESATLQQDMLCRVMGQCLHGDAIDMEVGDLTVPGFCPNSPQFTYVRYNRLFQTAEVRRLEKSCRCRFGLDSLPFMPVLEELGHAYALEHVQLSHLAGFRNPPTPNL